MSLIQSFTTRGGTTLASAAHVIGNLTRHQYNNETEDLIEDGTTTKIHKQTHTSDEIGFSLYVYKDDQSYATVTNEDVYFELVEGSWEDKWFSVPYDDLPAGDTLRDKIYSWLKTQAEFSSATDGLEPGAYVDPNV